MVNPCKALRISKTSPLTWPHPSPRHARLHPRSCSTTARKAPLNFCAYRRASSFGQNEWNWSPFFCSLMPQSLISSKTLLFFKHLSKSHWGLEWRRPQLWGTPDPNPLCTAQQSSRTQQQKADPKVSTTSSSHQPLHHSFTSLSLITAPSGSDAHRYKVLSFLPSLFFFSAFRQILPPFRSLLISLSCL